MKWALIYIFSTYPGGGTAIWDTGFRTTNYDVCTRQAISIRETIKTKQDLSLYGGRRFHIWSCVPIGG